MSKEIPQEEIALGLAPVALSSAIELLSDIDLEKRKLALHSLINARPGDQGYESLFENDILMHIISAFDVKNLPIIGTVCTAYRSIAFLNPSEADKYTASIPYQFLLSVKPNSEVIDFLSTQILNSLDGDVDVPTAIVSCEEFPAALELWLKSKDTKIVSSALDLINSCAMCNPELMDFSFVKEYAQEGYPADIRALALNIITQVQPEENVTEQIISLLQEEELGTVFFEIAHDMYQTNPDDFAEWLEPLITRCIQNFNLPPAALTIASANQNLNAEQQQAVVDTFFEMSDITPEQCFALYSVVSNNIQLLGEKEYMKIIKLYKRLFDVDTMMALEKIITLNNEFAISDVAQQCYLSIMKKGDEYAMHEIEFLVDLFEENQMIPELVQEIAHFKEDNNDKLAEINTKLELLIST